MKLTYAVAIACVVAGLAAAQSLAQDEQGQQGEEEASLGERFTAEYGALEQNNVFKRDRRPPPPPEPPREEEPPPPPPPEEKSWLLVGITMPDGVAPRAFFENQRERRMVEVGIGDDIANGRIGEFFIDAVSYVLDDGTIVWVDMGDDLTGEAALVTTPRPSSSGETSGSGSSNAETASGDGDSETSGGGESEENLSVIERMRLRRQQELRGGS